MQGKDGKFTKVHGLSNSSEYHIWANILYRCNAPTCADYAKYGGRGIKVSPEWCEFSNFYRDMGARPSMGHSIDRIDPNGDYTKENCRWATVREQNRNRRNTRKFIYRGENLTVMDIIEKYQLPKARTLNRLRRGWSIRDAVEKPDQPKFGRTA